MKTNAEVIFFVGTILGGSFGADGVWADQNDGAKAKTSWFSIAAKGMEEVCVKLAPPEKLRYAFTATGKLNFSVHYHVGDEVQFPVPEHLTASEKNSFAPAAAQTYCLMWENTGSETVELR